MRALIGCSISDFSLYNKGGALGEGCGACGCRRWYRFVGDGAYDPCGERKKTTTDKVVEFCAERGVFCCWWYVTCRHVFRMTAGKSAKSVVRELVKMREGENKSTNKQTPVITVGTGKLGKLGFGGNEEETVEGLFPTHAYTLLDIVSGKGLGLGEDLLKLRNPHGEGEWNGAWSDDAPEWEKYPAVKEKLQPEVADDGVFWMSSGDFGRLFREVHICKAGWE